MRKRKIILTIIFMIALLLVLYPFFASLYNDFVQQTMVAEYEESVSGITEEDYSQLMEEAIAWNQELYYYTEPGYFPDSMTNDEIYESLLDVTGTGMIGCIVIPKIDVNLPIYHYATEDVLLKGAGHMETSALPVGGESTHCVITAHRGLPTAAMFTDLDKLEVGDVFYLKVLGDTLAYEVTQINEVNPDDTTLLLPQEGEDLCTLVTCTPYGVNTMRLLVTGSRTEYTEEEEETARTGTAESLFTADRILLAAALAEILFYGFMMFRIKRDEEKNR